MMLTPHREMKREREMILPTSGVWEGRLKNHIAPFHKKKKVSNFVSQEGPHVSLEELNGHFSFLQEKASPDG